MDHPAAGRPLRDEAPALVVGPLLRYADDRSATVWVETDRPCTVSVLGASTRTWSVHGHHYALVVVTGLEPAATTPYTVTLDGAQVWPLPGGDLPPSVIRTSRPDDALRLAFGSCRRSAPYDRKGLRRFGADALVGLAHRLATRPRAEWPDTLLLLGDQIYADMPSDALRERLRERHSMAAEHTGRGEADVSDEVRDFEDYTALYRESWNVPEVRWLLSTVPTCMLLDDHDLRDDWNTSVSWRRDMERQPWWRDRVTGAFASYWVYQHLGNLSPAELAQDELLAAVTAATDDGERTRLVDEAARAADARPTTARWSFSRDLQAASGVRVRLVALDVRCSRHLAPDDRSIVDASEWEWARERLTGEVDHLLLATTLPAFLPHGVHRLEGWNEALAQGAWGPWVAGAAEKMRRLVDLEHWSAFRASFDALVEALGEVARGPQAPASVLVLSGDVHSSYTAQIRLPGVDPARTAVHQLVMSPFRNPLELPVKLANRLLAGGPLRRLTGVLARSAGVVDPPVDWEVEYGPWYDNGVMTVAVDGRSARAQIDHARVVDGRQVLHRTMDEALTGPYSGRPLQPDLPEPLAGAAP